MVYCHAILHMENGTFEHYLSVTSLETLLALLVQRSYADAGYLGYPFSIPISTIIVYNR
ncbi:hypothetical protein JCM18750_01210 [Halostagnicola bangensis]